MNYRVQRQLGMSYEDILYDMGDRLNAIEKALCGTKTAYIHDEFGWISEMQKANAKYNELRANIATQLEALKPWYISGKVGSPMDAVEALNNIDKAVRQ